MFSLHFKALGDLLSQATYTVYIASIQSVCTAGNFYEAMQRVCVILLEIRPTTSSVPSKPSSLYRLLYTSVSLFYI